MEESSFAASSFGLAGALSRLGAGMTLNE
jgi:hypothetical protein